jgi:hypothetical protein
MELKTEGATPPATWCREPSSFTINPGGIFTGFSLLQSEQGTAFVASKESNSRRVGMKKGEVATTGRSLGRVGISSGRGTTTGVRCAQECGRCLGNLAAMGTGAVNSSQPPFGFHERRRRIFPMPRDDRALLPDRALRTSSPVVSLTMAS